MAEEIDARLCSDEAAACMWHGFRCISEGDLRSQRGIEALHHKHGGAVRPNARSSLAERSELLGGVSMVPQPRAMAAMVVWLQVTMASEAATYSVSALTDQNGACTSIYAGV